MIIFNVVYFSGLRRDDLSDPGEELGEVCIANISPFERKKRLRFAAGQFLITLIVLAVLILLDVNPLWRLALLFMFSASTVSYFQARDKT